jgi:hypothetical protein
MNSKSAGVLAKPKERRRLPRIGEAKAINLKAIVRLSSNKVCPVKVINLSLHGTLLEFSREDPPVARVEEPISVKLQLSKDVVWLPGVVKHCYGSRMGVYFPEIRTAGKVSTSSTLMRVIQQFQKSDIVPSS